MLQAIRERAQGWLAWVIVALISIPFALWGIQSYLGVGGEPVVATVNGVEITDRDLSRRAQQARLELRERLGAAYDPALFEEGRLRAEVLDDMIRQTLLLDVSNRIGMRVSDEEVRMQILAESAFQRDGRFDREAYERLLSMQGLSPAQFEEQLRQQLIGNQLLRAVVGSELITSRELDDYRRLVGQTRELSYAVMPVADFRSDAPIGEEEIQAFYDANAARFQSPETVKLDYLVLDVAELAKGAEIGDDELRRVYEEDRSRFGQPEQRSVRHLLLTVPPDADEAAAQAVESRLQAIRDRILAGEAFEEVARSESQDPGSASEGGSLGTIEQGLMDPVFDTVAFGLPAGELSEPVRTRFGYHLIEVTEIVPAAVKSFDEVKDELRAEVSRQRAESLFYDLGERLANVAYESPDSLEPAADELGLALQQSDWLGREGGEGVFAYPRVMGAAFSDEVLGGRNNSDLIEPERDVLRAVVLRVADHRVAAVKPLEEVRDEIVEALRSERAREAALQAAESAAERLRQGTSWSEAIPSAVLETPGAVGRDLQSVPAPIRGLAFTLAAPGDGVPSVGTAVLEDGDVAVVGVTQIKDGEVTPPEGPSSASEAEMLVQLLGRHVYDAMLADMEMRAKVERNPLKTTSDL
ncbi:SurA N-terminal domain-containing protein [Thiocapsa marina]|uniref:Periplasmic chaperone PpiD n=1 Tax=Thiocapsa marina 5811 TaxID=768671 RepID=F9UBI8_9GAMM|nr:SurA N-terminal domain-containing protein [Thiocapsa marina]EGV18306.1 PpiC-type peptidyl-prolyl cis-trans isomerase [Thiocapsa marina 5811]